MSTHYFDCVVDTNELAKSVHTVNRHIDGTTGAVVAMQTAVVAAEKAGADRVCTNVNRGFYALIQSQISQKMAALQSEVDAKFMRLSQQKKQLGAIRARMTRDYQMICARYAKLFNTLNRALKQRIFELDQPIMNLVQTDASKVTNRQNLLVADVPLGQEETVKVSQKIAVSKMKHQAVQTIDTITRFLSDSKRLERITQEILLRKQIHSTDESWMVPVAVMQSNFDESGNEVTQTYVSEAGLSQAARNQIDTSVGNAVRNEEFKWKEPQTVNEELNNQFRILVNDSGLDERRKREILRLFGHNNFETL